ncbi:hypothetical protein ACQKQA_19665 [Pseudomonas sp. NPDC089530]|uniref:hypothetical protein n=1 Tax=Pseudomonas sp. NPDC089530 TaxID=3390651 RepID=UPI003D025EE3
MSLDAVGRYHAVRISTGQLAHSLPAAVFYLAHVWGVPLYRSQFGSIAKGFGLGMMVELLLQLLMVVSFLLALAPNLKVKLGLIGALALFTAWAMFPDHPIRGYIYCCLMTVPPLLAIWLAQWLCRLFYRQGLPHGN